MELASRAARLGGKMKKGKENPKKTASNKQTNLFAFEASLDNDCNH